MTKKSFPKKNKLQRDNEMGQTRPPEGKKKTKLNLPSADQHEVFFSAKPIKTDFIATHCLDNQFLLKGSIFFFLSIKQISPTFAQSQ